MVFQIVEIIWYLLVPTTFTALFVFRKWTKHIGYAECLLPVSILCIEMLNRLLIPFSLWPYILFIYAWLGFVQLFVNYRANLYFTFGEFFRKWFKLISSINIVIWLILVIWRVTNLFLI